MLSSLPIAKTQEWVLAIMLVIGCFLFPAEWTKYLVELKRILFVLGILVLGGLSLTKEGVRMPLDAYSLIFLSFVLWNFLSIFWAVNPSLIWTKSFDWLLLFLFYLTLRMQNIKAFNPIFWKNVLLVIVASNTILLLWFYWQISLEGGQFSLSLSEILSVSTYFRLNGNYIASMQLLFIPFLFLQDKRNKIFFFLLTLNLLFILLFNSRAVTIALISIIIFYGLVNFNFSKIKKTLFYFISLIIAFGCLVFVLEDSQHFIEQYNPFSTILQQTGDERPLMWQRSLLLFKEQPLLGHGSGNWLIEHLKYGLTDFRRIYSHAHNLMIETLAELGIIGGGLIIFLLFSPFKILCQKARNMEKIQAAAFAVLIGYIITSSFYGVVYFQNHFFPIHSFIWMLSVVIVLNNLAVISSNYSVQKTFFISNFIVLAFSVYSIYYKHNSFLFRTGDHQKALSAIDNTYIEGFREFHGRTHLYTHRAKKKWLKGEKQEAIVLLEKSLLKNPYDQFAWFELSNMYLEQKMPDKAIIAQDKSLAIDRKYYEASIASAKLALLLRDWDKFEEATALYYEDLLPIKAKHYRPGVLKNKKKFIRDFWVKQLSYEAQYLELFRQKEKVNKIPENLLVYGKDSTTAILRWDRIIDAKHYTIQYRELGINKWKTIPTVRSPQILENLVISKKYEWKVQGNAAYSNTPYSLVQEFVFKECHLPSNIVIKDKILVKENYQSAMTITTNGIIQKDHTVTMAAGEEIILKTGFHAKAGSRFEAKIGICLLTDED